MHLQHEIVWLDRSWLHRFKFARMSDHPAVLDYPWRDRLALSKKSTLIAIVKKKLWALWHDHGIPSELTIKGKNGKIQDRRTYGEDPRRSKG